MAATFDKSGSTARRGSAPSLESHPKKKDEKDMTKTVKVIKDRANDITRMTTVGEFADARFKDLRNVPSLQALKLHALMFKAAGGAVADDRWHQVNLSELRSSSGIKNYTRETLIDQLAELRGVVMEWNDIKPDGTKFTSIAGLLDIADVDFDDQDGRAIMRWKFGEGLRRIVESSDYWAVIDRQTMLSMGSRYSLRMFEILSVRANLKHKQSEIFTVEDLRARLGVPEGKLPLWADFNRRVLVPALAEVSHVSRIQAKHLPIKKGRKVNAVKIEWYVKKDLSATKRELNSTKVGRKARREGTSEITTLSFPSTGRISANWEKIARDNAPRIQGNHVPDLLVLSNSFRKWCGEKSISLDAKSIEKTFTTWCKRYSPR